MPQTKSAKRRARQQRAAQRACAATRPAAKTKQPRKKRTAPLGRATKSETYELANPIASAMYAPVRAMQAPRLAGSAGLVRVKHREMIGTISNSAAFAVGLAGSLNPGLPTTPGVFTPDTSIYSWIQPMANLFEKYRIEQMRVVYEPSCAVVETGTVAMMIDYDSLDGPPTSIKEVLASQNAVYGPPWKGFSMNVRPQPLPLWTRPGAAPAVSDLKTYDFGNLFICTEGSGTNAVGRVFVEYVIALIVPQA